MGDVGVGAKECDAGARGGDVGAKEGDVGDGVEEVVAPTADGGLQEHKVE